MVAVTVAAEDALAIPDAGVASRHPCVVDTVKFKLPAPLFNTVTVCGAGAAPPLTVWKRNPVEESWICCWLLPTVTTTGMAIRCPEGVIVIFIAPVYVPWAKALESTTAITDPFVNGPTPPLVGETDSQLPPACVVAEAVKVWATPL